jgi:hypothetical protein
MNCQCCGAPLPKRFSHYDHDGGYNVAGFAEPQWLYLDCPRCGYGESLWKALNRSRAHTLRQYEKAIAELPEVSR